MRSFVLAAAALAALAAPGIARAQEAPVPPSHSWSFDGIFGSYDLAAAQRGYLVYSQVCANCHSMNLLYFRDLEGIGFTPDQVKALAAQVQVEDGPNDQGKMFERPGKASDHFKPPFANPQAARAALNGALPPDLSLIVKARHYGSDYVDAILTGFRDPPAGFKVNEGMNYNEYFPGHQIAMPPPLSDGAVTYADGTKATVDQMAHDVATFLAWASDPHLEDRHRMGIRVIIFLVILTGVLYGVKRKVWADVH
jgi:ubiquinol-cytochrome c reductase cytochrome c1 subunit